MSAGMWPTSDRCGGRRSTTATSWPARFSRSTTCEPMKPPPPVTRVRMPTRTLVPGPPPIWERGLPCLNVSGQAPDPARPRRIAVVPAYNEEPTVEAVLDRLYPLVDELVVVDDGSSDHTRKIIEEWLADVAAPAAPVGGKPPVPPGAPRATLLSFDENRGMSAAYYEAFSHLAARLQAGEISP